MTLPSTLAWTSHFQASPYSQPNGGVAWGGCGISEGMAKFSPAKNSPRLGLKLEKEEEEEEEEK